MKKRILSCLMALALCLTLLPTAALAEETEGTAQTPPAVEKAADPANGEAKQEGQPAEAKQENQSAEVKQENQPAEQEEQQEDSAAKQAVAAVQAMIDALPDAADLDGMDDAEAMEVYEAFQTACEAYYDTLSEKQQAQLKNTEKLAALSERFSQLETLAAGDTHTHFLCGGADCNEKGHKKEETATTFDKWLASSSSGKYALNVGGKGSSSETGGDGLNPVGGKYVLPDGSYYLKTGDGFDSDVTIEYPIQIKGTVTICLNGKTIQNRTNDQPVFEVVSGGKLTLTDCENNNKGKVTRAYNSHGSGVEVNGGEFNLYGGSITKNTADNGGGVYVYNSGEFNMYGGSITLNTAAKGGGVKVDGGKFNLYGGEIANNKAEGKNSTGGVYVVNGTFTMSGGTISGNTANYTNGADGGVGVYNNATFNMSGGEITGNEASSFSGGVGVHNLATFIMRGGTIGGATDGDANNAKYGGGVNVGNNGKFEMSGGKISGNKATENGGGVCVAATGEFNMRGGEISGNIAATYGGGVYVATTGEFNMRGGTIGGAAADKANKANKANYGGGVYVDGGGTLNMSGGKFTMSGGEISVNTATSNGGGVYVGGSGSTFIMNGNASITDNTATSNGGGVYEGGGKFNMSGGASISRNEATTGNGGGVYVGGGVFTMSGGSITSNHTANKANYGGGVYVDTHGTFNMSGGTIGGAAADKANKAKNGGGGVYVSGGTFNMSGGSITGNDSNGVFVDDRATFTVSGAATVKGNTREGAASNVFLTWGAKITIGTGGLNCPDGSIGVTKGAGSAGNAIATGATGVTLSDEIAKKFKIDDSTYVVKYKDNQLVLAEKDTSAETHTHCLCGKTHTAIGDHETDTQITFATKLWMDNGVLKKGNGDWTKGTVKRADSGNDSREGYVLTAGSYYLENDLTLSGAAILIDGDVKLCLNGHTIDRANGNAALDYVIRVLGKNAHLTLTDCMGGGKLTGGKYGGVDIFNSCTLDMFGGTITGNEFNGGVDVGQFGTFNLYGGKITGNSAEYGGGVYNGGTVNMYGGEISDNTASNKGGGVYMAASMGNYQGGILNVSGAAKITGNTVDGTPNNVYLPSSKTITIGGGGLSGQIGVTTKTEPTKENPVTITTGGGTIADITNKITSDDNKYKTAVKGNDLVLQVNGDGGGTPAEHIHNWTYTANGATITATCTGAGVCNFNNDGGRVTIKAPTDLTYDGKVKHVTVERSGNWESAFSEDIAISYHKFTGGSYAEMGEGPTVVGKYKAITTVHGATAFVEYEITGGTTPSQPSNPGGSTGGNTGGSSSGGGGGSSSGGSDSNPIIKTETKNNTDGSTTKTETRRDGSVTQTTTGKDGSVSKTETKPNGSSVTENKAADGSTGTVKTDKNGQTEAKTALSNKAVEDAKKSGEAVKAPVEVKASRDSSTAPTVKVELPKGAGETKVEIPVSNVKSGTVAVLVHPDGTEEILKNSIPTEDGIQLTVDGNATVKIVDNSKGFIDTRNHWAEDAIDFVSARGLVNGMSDTIYAPNNSTTRAQLWTILARQNDADLSGGSVWYEKAQNWAKDKGVSDGANPNAAINRAQMVTMLWRAVGQPAAGGAATFTDVSADAYYAGAVSWAVENGITTGVGGGRFDPTGACTRAQIAAFLTRLYAEK